MTGTVELHQTIGNARKDGIFGLEKGNRVAVEESCLQTNYFGNAMVAR